MNLKQRSALELLDAFDDDGNSIGYVSIETWPGENTPTKALCYIEDYIGSQMIGRVNTGGMSRNRIIEEIHQIFKDYFVENQK